MKRQSDLPRRPTLRHVLKLVSHTGINLADCTSLAALPEDLKVVDGDLDLSGCARLTKLPEGLHVEGNLDLSGCTRLTILPEGLYVGGILNLSDCTKLTALPEGHHIGTGIHATDCTSLTTLPDSLQVEGDVDLSGCTALVALPSHLRYPGDLILRGCIALAALPEGLSVLYNLSLSGCTSLTALPKLRVGGDLDLSGCTALVALPQHFSARRSLNLSDCISLKALPRAMTVGGVLDVSGCRMLAALPDGLRVGKSLDLSECFLLKSLPARVHVGDDIDLSGCTSLTTLPKRLRVDGDLDLSHCTSLTALPVGLQISGSINLAGCHLLTALPEDLQVDGDVDLSDCLSLGTLPERLRFGGSLILSHCRSLTTLPDWVSRLGADNRRRGGIRSLTRSVYLGGTGLPNGVIQRLRALSPAGMRFHFSVYEGFPVEPLHWRTVVEMRNFWLAKAVCHGVPLSSGADQIPVTFAPDVELALLSFAHRIIETTAYKNLRTRPAVVSAVLQLMQLMENDSLRPILAQLMEDGVTTCGDGVALALDAIHFLLRIEEAKRGGMSESELRELGRGMQRLAMVDERAKERAASIAFVDEIEVILAFRTVLAERLGLPLLSQQMLYREAADVTDEEIRLVGDAILTECTEASLGPFLDRWEPWQQQRRRLEVTPYDSLPRASAPRRKQRTDECVITQVVPEQPVLFQGRLYAYEALVRVFIESAISPYDNSIMRWVDVQRI